MNRFINSPGIRHALRFTLGWIFMVLGIAGLFLPILQGILFLAIGMALLAPYIPLFQRMKLALYRKYPKLEEKILRLKQKFHREP